ncbi:toprim domain-containing protein [Lactococcus cremoris]
MVVIDSFKNNNLFTLVPYSNVSEIEQKNLQKRLQEFYDKAEKYVEGYKNYVALSNKPSQSEFKYSSLQYFHKELGIEQQNIQEDQSLTEKRDRANQEKNVQRDAIPQNKQTYQKKGFKRISDEQVENAKNTSILAYAQAQGIQLEKTAQNEYRVSGTKIKFSTDKNLFSDYAGNTRNNGNKESGDVIAFAKYMKGLNFGQAVRDVLGTEGAGTYEVSQEQVPFSMPKSIINPEHFEEGMIYMTKDRMIDSNMVLDLYRSGLIRQTKNGEVAFIWANGAEDVGLTLQGTQPLDYRSQITENEKGGYDWKTGIGSKGLEKYPLKTDHAETYEQAEEAVAEDIAHRRPFKKQIWKNSTPKKGFNFTKTVPKEQMTKSSLSLGESAIDCISFAENQAERFREPGHLAVFQSLEGAHTKLATAVQAVEDFKTKYGQLPDEVIIATDNDKDGNLVEDKFKALPAVQEYMKQGVKVVRAKPDHGKDWNDALKFSKSPIQQGLRPRISPNIPKGCSI